ncbi:chloride channel protein E-like [Calliphora vicina]|uniref:chloride channel protein E-like n=1 Tax=Calliphora vicina TaxID=7373 RepID=UPI00325AB55E
MDGKEVVSTGAAIITFDLIYRPEELKLGWESVSVDEYIPNPMKCQNCQKLGHTRKRCRNIEICKECGTPTPHDSCTRKFCVNCQLDSHTSYDPNCPTFWKHKSVNHLRISRRCTNREAWDIYNNNPITNTLKPVPRRGTNIRTYAQVLNDQQASNNFSNSTTTILQNKSKHVASENVTNTNNKNENSTNNTTHSTKTTVSPLKIKISSTSLNNNEIDSPSKQITTPMNTTIFSQDNQASSPTLNISAEQNKILETTTSATYKQNNDDIFYRDDTLMNDNFSSNINFDDDLTEDMIVSDISEGLGLASPPRQDSCSPNCETTPTSQLFKTFPDLNVIITPKTFKKTKNVMKSDEK